MSTPHDSPRLRRSLNTLVLGLGLGLGGGVLLGACADEAESETCFELEKFEEEGGLICGTTQTERASMTNGLYSELYYHCVPLNECPNECPAEDVINDHIIPGYAQEDPDYVIGEVIPLCMKNDVAAGNCCFISLLVEG